MAEDYAENLFQAVDTIVAERVKNLPYDHTVVATVLDASNAYTGTYKVTTDNNAKFTAYSDIKTYNAGDRVYVRIIDTDYYSSKTIVGKYIEPVNIKSSSSDIIEYTISDGSGTLNLNKELAAQGYYLEIRGAGDNDGTNDYSPDDTAQITATLDVNFYKLEINNNQFIATPITTGYNYRYGVNDGTRLFIYDKILDGQYDTLVEQALGEQIVVQFMPLQQTAQSYVSIRCYITLSSGVIIRSNVFIIKSDTKLSKQYRLFDLDVDRDQFFVFNAKGIQISHQPTITVTITYTNVFDTNAKFSNQDSISITSSRNNSMFTYLSPITPNNSNIVEIELSLKDNIILDTSFLVETLTFTITKDKVNYILTKDFYFGYQQIDSLEENKPVQLFLTDTMSLDYHKINIGDLLTTNYSDDTFTMNLGGKSLKQNGTWEGTAAAATMATNLSAKPVLTNDSNKIKITIGDKTSDALEVNYAASAGKLTTDAGSGIQLISITSGVPTVSTDSVGYTNNKSQPIYLDNGTLTAIPLVTINGNQYTINDALDKIVSALTNNVALQSNHTLWQNT